MDVAGFTVKRCQYCTVMETPEVIQVIKLYRFFKLGHLPFPGTVMDQPAKIMQAFQLIEEIDRWQQQAE